MTDANTLKPLVQMMLDVSNGKGEFERTDLEVIRDNAPAYRRQSRRTLVYLQSKL
ncbi:MAG: hypothetical protein ACK502_05195 [Alphaproteobacteria bacterium]|jgi:hypothetical protein